MNRSGKILPILTGLVLIVIFLALVSTRDETAGSSRRFSTYSANPTGVKAFYLLLKESGLDGIRWRKETRRLDPDERIIYVTVAPVENYSAADIDFLYEKVRRGSICIFFYGPTLEAVIGRFGMTAGPTVRPSEFRLQAPAGHAAVYDRLHVPCDVDSAWNVEGGYYALEGEGLPLYGSDSLHYVAETALDSGAVVVFGSPNFVANACVGDSLNVTAIVQILLHDTRGRPRIFQRIVFDEYHQGHKEYQSFLRFLDDPAVKVGCVLGLLALLTFVYSRAKRIGRAVPIQTRSVRNSLDYVDSVANVYQRARANRWVLKTWYEWVRSRYAIRFHIHRNDRLADQLSKRYGFGKEEVLRLMETVEKKLEDSDIDRTGEEPVRKRPVAISDDELVALVKRLDQLHAAQVDQTKKRK